MIVPGEVTAAVSQLADVVGVAGHPAGNEYVTDAVAPVAETAEPEDENEALHPAPTCVTVTVRPATVIVAERVALEGLVVTENRTVLVPVAGLPDVIVNQD